MVSFPDGFCSLNEAEAPTLRTCVGGVGASNIVQTRNLVKFRAFAIIFASTAPTKKPRAFGKTTPPTTAERSLHKLVQGVQSARA